MKLIKITPQAERISTLLTSFYFKISLNYKMTNTLKRYMGEVGLQLDKMKNKVTEMARNLHHDWECLDVKFKIIILVLGLLLLWEFIKDKTVLFIVAVIIIIFFAISF